MTAARRPFVAPPELVAELNALAKTFDASRVGGDPVRYAHACASAADREVVAFLAAMCAFGVVGAIFGTLDRLLPRLGTAPAAAVASLDARAARALTAGIRHRWVGPDDWARLLAALGSLLREHGSLGNGFAAVDRADDPTVEAGLGAFAADLRRRTGRTLARPAKFLLPLPGGGSACKRMNLFLRWMARPADGVDLGLWSHVAPARLIMPVDTHVAFHARVLGFTRRKQADWKMALEVTAALRTLDPVDPVRYDFALCHLGIHGGCRKKRHVEVCPACPLDAFCRLPQPRPKKR